MSTLYVMCGIPGSGKSSFIASHINEDKMICISRDKIRFQFVAEDEEYFSKENEVWKEFVRQINYFLGKGYDVIADATHINQGSRRKLLNEITVKGIDYKAIYMDTPVSICLERNSLRKGRACVPSTAIKRMYSQFEEPIIEEGFSVIMRVPYKKENELKKGGI